MEVDCNAFHCTEMKCIDSMQCLNYAHDDFNANASKITAQY